MLVAAEVVGGGGDAGPPSKYRETAGRGVLGGSVEGPCRVSLPSAAACRITPSFALK